MTLAEAISTLAVIKGPEDIFGNVYDEAMFKRVDREWLTSIHPDKNDNSRASEEAFKAYGEWKEKAEFKIKNGTYGDRSALTEEIKLTAKSGIYTLTRRVAEGDIANIYSGTDKDGNPIVAKVCRTPINNDLLLNEATQLRWIFDESEAKAMGTLIHLPRLIDTFELKQGSEHRRVNIFKHLKNYWTLADVMKEYPEGLDLRDAAWMFRRLLGAMVASEKAYVVHGAILSTHFMICCDGDDDHNGVLIDWCYSVKVGSNSDIIKAVSPAFKACYPPEVLAKKPAKVGTDVYMAARVLADLLKWKIEGERLIAPKDAPRKIHGLLRACLFASMKMRVSSPWELHDDFGEAITELFGPRKFRKFHMPRKA